MINVTKDAGNAEAWLACSAMERRFRINALGIILIVVAVAFFVVGIIYLTQTTNHLPSFIPVSRRRGC